jgi:hypothetical protein
MLIKSRGMLAFWLADAIAVGLVFANIAASVAQQLPPGGVPIPPLRRGAGGEIEVVPPSAKPPPVATSPNAGAHPATSRPSAPPSDAASKFTRPWTQRVPARNASEIGNRSSLRTTWKPSDNKWVSPALAIGTINIANAPEWQQSHAYIVGDRVVAGPALVIPSTYTNGSNLYLWAVDAGGGGTSSGSGNGPQTCTTPAGTGGIPTATWAGATRVTDGGVSFVCLTKVDYVTITGFGCDDARNWVTGTVYHLIDSVVRSGHCYTNNVVFNGTDPCTSGSGPTGTTFNSPVIDNGCRWWYEGDVIYSSQANRLPHQLYNEAGGYIIQYAQNVTVQLWWGGNQRTHYGPGQPGELSPLQIHWHSDYTGEYAMFCIDGTTDITNCVSAGVPYVVTYSPAPGDGLKDNCPPSSCPLRYDETKGVAIFNNAAPGANGAAETLNLGDSYTQLTGLQIQSTQSAALPTTTNGGDYALGPSNTNGVHIKQSILIGASAGVVSCDYDCNIDNSLLILNSSTTDAIIAYFKYQAAIHDSTFICAGGATNSTAIGQRNFLGANTAPPWNNNLILGCVNNYAVALVGTAPSGANNATDNANSGGGTFSDLWLGSTLTITAMPGVALSGITAANQLVNPTVGGSFDGRVKNTGADIYGAGATFSFSQSGSQSMAVYSPVTPGLDILGTTRPVSGRYDIGAVMFIGGSPPPVYVTKPFSGHIQ